MLLSTTKRLKVVYNLYYKIAPSRVVRWWVLSHRSHAIGRSRWAEASLEWGVRGVAAASTAHGRSAALIAIRSGGYEPSCCVEAW